VQNETINEEEFKEFIVEIANFKQKAILDDTFD
jgi:hypothetical protein